MVDSKNAGFTSANIIRPVGRLESFHITRTTLGLYTSVMIGAQFLSTSGLAKLNKNTLFPALRRVIRREPALRMAIAGLRVPAQTSQLPAFVSCEVDDSVLDKICFFHDDVGWNEEHMAKFTGLVAAEFEVAFDADDMKMPLWRVVVCRDTVLFYYHHGIGDGKSGVAFHVMLLEALNSGPDASPPPAHQPIPSIEDCVDVRPSLRFILSSLLDVFTPASWSNLHYTWTGNPVPSAKNSGEPKDSIASLGLTPQVRVELLEFSKDEVDKLVATCREHKATVTSALYNMAIVVLSQIVTDVVNTGNSTPFTKISTTVPVSLRPLSGAPEIAFCDHPSSWRTCVDLQSEFRWEDAKRHAEALSSSMKNGEPAQAVGLLWSLFGKHADYFRGQMGKKRATTFALSNVGRFSSLPVGNDIKDDDEGSGECQWTIGKTIFGHGSVICESAFHMNVVGHATGGMTVCMSWGPYLLDEELAKKIVLNMKAGLRGLVEKP